MRWPTPSSLPAIDDGLLDRPREPLCRRAEPQHLLERRGAVGRICRHLSPLVRIAPQFHQAVGHHLGQRLRTAEEDGGQYRSADLLVGQGPAVQAEVQQPVDQRVAPVRPGGPPVADHVGHQIGELPVGHALGRHVLDARVADQHGVAHHLGIGERDTEHVAHGRGGDHAAVLTGHIEPTPWDELVEPGPGHGADELFEALHGIAPERRTHGLAELLVHR